MSKELTEKLRDGTIKRGYYYLSNGKENYVHEIIIIKPHFPPPRNITVLAPVPSYDKLYNKDNGIIPVLQIMKKGIERVQCIRELTDLECGIKSQVVSLLKLWGVK